MTPKGHAIPSKTQLLSYGTPALPGCFFAFAAVKNYERMIKSSL